MKIPRGIGLLLTVLFCAASAFAGGPLYVGGPTVGVDGKPLTWDPAKMPIQYRLDPGPLATTSSGQVVIDHNAGAQRIQNMLATWQGVSTAAISFNNAGAILAAGAYTGGDVTTVAQYNAIVGSCKAGTQSPVIFDANSSLGTSLGMPAEVIGFTNVCSFDSAGHINAAMITLNGKMQDGVSTNTATPNYELTASQFDETITHEFGHFIGLDHSQINLELFNGFYNNACDLDLHAGLPLMFPIEFCDARKDVGLPLLAPDDIAWVSKLYPGASQSLAYGIISGRIYFSDATSQFQGANVIARSVDDPHTPEDENRRIAVSVISGFAFTGNLGQSVTADMASPSEHNVAGSRYGSRNAQLIGYYEIPVPPGTYTIEVEPVSDYFEGGSGMGPMYVPVTNVAKEFWNSNESAFDNLLERDTVVVNGGDNASGNDIILNYQPSTFDPYEDGGMVMVVPFLPSDSPANKEGL